MREMANKVQAVMNTLESLDIKSTYENTNKLLGCFQVLAEIRNELNTVATIQEENQKRLQAAATDMLAGKHLQEENQKKQKDGEENDVGTADTE